MGTSKPIEFGRPYSKSKQRCGTVFRQAATLWPPGKLGTGEPSAPFPATGAMPRWRLSLHVRRWDYAAGKQGLGYFWFEASV